MKKITILIIGAICILSDIYAQDNKAIDVTARGIQIGQQVPDIEITNLHNYKDTNGKTVTVAKISDFKGKLIILDFWATWCSPCVAAIPKMNDLQKQFDGKLQILSITYQNEKETNMFLSKLPDTSRPKFPVVTDDKAIANYFPHKFLPHYVWIDGQGKVIAISGLDAVTAKNISAIIEGQTSGIQQKHDFSLAYDDQKPFLLEGNGGSGKSMRFHSVFTGYQLGLPSSYNTFDGKQISGKRITFLNVTIPHLFAYAMGANKGAFNFKNMRFLVKDKSDLVMTGDYKQWIPEHTFCYELIVPKSLEGDKYSMMLADLKRMFPTYQVSTETSQEKVLALVRTDQTDRLKSKGGETLSKFDGMGFELRNFPLNRLVAQLSAIYLQNHPLHIINDTEYTDRVDISVNASLSNVEALNQGLQPYGLALEIKEKEVEVLVFRDILEK